MLPYPKMIPLLMNSLKLLHQTWHDVKWFMGLYDLTPFPPLHSPFFCLIYGQLLESHSDWNCHMLVCVFYSFKIFCYDMIPIYTSPPLLLFAPIRKVPIEAMGVLEMQQDRWGCTFLKSPPLCHDHGLSTLSNHHLGWKPNGNSPFQDHQYSSKPY